MKRIVEREAAGIFHQVAIQHKMHRCGFAVSPSALGAHSAAFRSPRGLNRPFEMVWRASPKWDCSGGNATDDDAFSDEAAASFGQSKETTPTALPADSPCCGGQHRFGTVGDIISSGGRVRPDSAFQACTVCSPCDNTSIRREEARR
jgi:hypothetical protein